MRGVELWAVSRYRFTTIVRRAGWMFPLLAVAILVPLAATGDSLFGSDTAYRSFADDALDTAATATAWIYVLHLITLVTLCRSFGTVPQRPEGASPSDLMDTAPISGYTRYFGDAFGIFVATMALHFCALPVLVHSIAATTFPVRVVWYLELLIAVVIFFISCAAAWALRAVNTRWSQTRTLRASAVLLILLFLILAVTVRSDFGESVVIFLSVPSERSLAIIRSTIHAPFLLGALLAVLYAGFTLYYSVQTARAIERT